LQETTRDVLQPNLYLHLSTDPPSPPLRPR
jgi:hypothetical protein